MAGEGSVGVFDANTSTNKLIDTTEIYNANSNTTIVRQNIVISGPNDPRDVAPVDFGKGLKVSLGDTGESQLNTNDILLLVLKELRLMNMILTDTLGFKTDLDSLRGDINVN